MAFESLEKKASVIALLAVVFASARIAATYTVFNHTFDEPSHINCGMEWLDQGIYTWEAQHPPLARVASAIGPYLIGVRSQPQDRSVPNAGLIAGTKILYAGHHYDLTLAAARLGVLPFFWISALVIYQWGKQYFTRLVAVLAVLVFTFLPSVLAHAGLATTDMALTAFTGAAFLTGMMCVERPSAPRSVLFGLCAGLGVLSKFSFLVFFPASSVAALGCYYAIVRPKMVDLRKTIRPRLPALALSGFVAFLVIWAGYRFSTGPAAFSGMWVPFPELYAGIDAVWRHNIGGHHTYLFGQRSMSGWWYFFPVVLAVKTPLPVLVMCAVWLLLTLRGRISFQWNWIPFAFVSAIMIVAMASRINIGIRHILPVFFGISLLSAIGAVEMLRNFRKTAWALPALGVLTFWLAGSSLLSHPDYLPYFNELAGNHPEDIVVDSDLDWGQDIKRLAARLKELGAKEVYLSTLLMADFEREHGIPHRLDRLDLINPPTGFVAIGFTYWKQTRMGLNDDLPQYALWPDHVPPTEKVGKSMLLWCFPPSIR